MITEVVKCSFCDQNTSVGDMKYCQYCCDNICVKCAVTHRRNETFKNHQIESVIKICCKHHSRTCEYFCVECDQFLCRICVHRQSGICHPKSIKDMKILKEEKMKAITESLTKMKKEIHFLGSDIKADLDSIKRMLKEINEIKSAVNRHVTELIAKIKTKEKDLMDVIEVYEKRFVYNQNILSSKLTDKPFIQELKKTAEEGLKGGIEHVIITTLLLTSQLPTEVGVPPDNNLDTVKKFIAEDSINVGQLQITNDTTTTGLTNSRQRGNMGPMNWPGSVAEFNKLIEPLAHPERFGGDVADAFDVIAPSSKVASMFIVSSSISTNTGVAPVVSDPAG